MTRSAKSRYVLKLIGLAATAALAALAGPQATGAAPADNEYDLNLPGGDGKGVDPSANSSSGSDAAPAAGSPDTAVATEPAAPASGADVEPAGDDAAAGAGAADPDKKARRTDRNASAANDRASEAGALKTRGGPSKGDGIPVPLLVIAAIGLALLLAAAWRFRNSEIADPAQATGRSG